MQRALMVTVLICLWCTACATVEKTLADSRLAEAQKSFDEGQKLINAGKYAEAAPLVEHALETREAVLAGMHPKIADCLSLLGEVHVKLADFARAEPLLVRALKIRKGALGENHPSVAEALTNLAVLYSSQGFYARAEPLFAHALKIRKAAFGEKHPDVAEALNELASIYYLQGLYARAEPLAARALEIREAVLGDAHPDFAESLNNLAAIYSSEGLYARAEPLFARALKIRQAARGPNHPDVAESLNNLAGIYQAQGLYERAEPLLVRALEILEAALGDRHPDVAYSLYCLALLYSFQELHARAEPLYVRALEIWEETLGENHPTVAEVLSSLAVLYHHQGFYERAEPLMTRALGLQEAALGPEHPDVAGSLNNLASLYQAQGFYTRAELLFARAIKIWEAALGENHPNVTNSIHNLARFHLIQGQVDTALPLLQRALTSSEQHLRQEVFGFSEQSLATFLHLLRAQEERLYALVRSHPDDPRLVHLALSAALLRKGRSVQESSNTSSIIYRSMDSADRVAFDRLRSLRTQLATLSLAGPGMLSPADYRQRLKDLAAEGDFLEEDLVRRSGPLRRLHDLPPPGQLISQVTAALPPDSAIVEFVAYQDRALLAKPGLLPSQVDNHLRYLALLLFADGRSRAVDLGPAEPIDRAALRLHDTLARKSASYLSAAQALHTLAFLPLVPHLGQKRRLFLAPDGQLNLVPFAALHDGRRFLVDAFHITYLTSGKDLLPRSEDLPPSNSVVVLASPDFGSPLAAATPEEQTAPALAQRAALLEDFFTTLRSNGPDIPWAPLPGTRAEAESILRLFPQAQLLLGPDATKQALLRLPTPGLLHIATHGFFLEDSSPVSAARGVGNFGAVGSSPAQRPSDPLLRSGLVLAGIQHPTAPAGTRRIEESLVTALELAGLNLWGTQLVVLSACDTGRGDVRLGDGVYGLRRAFLVAGAETVVTSLWKVNDEVTRQLMERYYRHLLAGLGRTHALREAMKELRRMHPHPHFWAAFTALGLDAPLQ
ncbi:CHAT domain-containing tetratricopeptide repeat protein, partial [Hyalangium sp.]|uniref:CHAT domain-containing tetratricopeptide repeat protein n=1 Tax=Hyalangium sp. TaxID=2028555 RepID=UPI002D55502C